jgi:hypothetical protein
LAYFGPLAKEAGQADNAKANAGRARLLTELPKLASLLERLPEKQSVPLHRESGEPGE